MSVCVCLAVCLCVCVHDNGSIHLKLEHIVVYEIAQTSSTLGIIVRLRSRSARGHARKLKIRQLCSSAIYKQNVSISLRLSDFVQYRRGYYFRAWVLENALEQGCYY